MNSVKKHSGIFTFGSKVVPYSYWSNLEQDHTPDVVIFLGAGAAGPITRMVARRAGTGVVVVDGIPHWYADPSAENISEFSKHYFLFAYHTVLATFHVASLHVIGESQAAPAPILLAISSPNEIQNIALLRPLGFTVESFGDTPDMRLRTFRNRILQTYLQLPQSFLHDPRNLIVGLTIFRAMLLEPTITSLSKKYTAGISYDLLPECKTAAKIQRHKGDTVTIILGEKDKMFPPREITAALELSDVEDVDVEIIPADGHSSLAVRASGRALHTALNKVRRVSHSRP